MLIESFDRVMRDSLHSMDFQAFIEMFVYLNKQSKHVWWSPKPGSGGTLSGDSMNWSFLTFPLVLSLAYDSPLWIISPINIRCSWCFLVIPDL